ncbi:hypothetical protein PI124_g8512 [Phytophthora idaei]|nr:hypothetical protein PI125_g17790 [Phytophthora idaei]KAG3139242.1 hypothetical protein PI126_g16551 [Phytophthora idaei]KAG3246767.1 hypothetical protein PI124_g8512 [Phytophthora idaei]
MVRADVTTPRVLKEVSASPPGLQRASLDQQTREQLDTLDDYRGELARAAFAAEVTALGYANRQGDDNRVMTRSAALVE